MVTIPGLAVGMLALFGVLVTLGLIAAVRAWLSPITLGLAALLRRVPFVGGFLSRGVLGFDRTVLGWLANAARHAERFALGWFRGLETLVERIGDEIAGVALDAANAVVRLIRVKVPALLRAARSELFRLVHAAETRILIVERRIARVAGILEARVLQLGREAAAAIRAGVLSAEHYAFAQVGFLERRFIAALGAVRKSVETVEYRIGRAEASLFNAVWPELRRLAHDLRPDVVAGFVLDHVWRLIPADVQLFLRWLWHLIAESGEFLAALVRGDWPGPITHDTMRGHLESIAADSKSFAQSIYDEHRGG